MQVFMVLIRFASSPFLFGNRVGPGNPNCGAHIPSVAFGQALKIVWLAFYH